MSYFVLFVVCLLLVILVGKMKSQQKIKKIGFSEGYTKLLPEWVEILNPEDRVWAVGRRISWLPAEEFGDGACILLGIIDLTGTDPALRVAIENSFSIKVFDDNRIVARILAHASKSERLIVGSFDDVETQDKVNSASKDFDPKSGLCVQVSSDSISPIIEAADRKIFDGIWDKYAADSNPR